MARATAIGLGELMRAVYAVLNRPPITAPPLNARVYDDIPQGTTLPVVQIEITPGESWDTFGRAGHTHLIDVHVFTNYAGTEQAAGLLDAITNELDGVRLPVVGYRVEDIARQPHRTGEDELVGGVKTRHRVAPFRVLMLTGEEP